MTGAARSAGNVGSCANSTPWYKRTIQTRPVMSAKVTASGRPDGWGSTSAAIVSGHRRRVLKRRVWNLR